MEGGIHSSRPLRVLVVARWYPSHDQPGRGSFVADLVAALRALPSPGVEVVVASFEATHVRGVAATRPDRGRRAATLMGTALAGEAALGRPTSWGVPGVAVARLPVFLDGERRRPSDVADAHAASLLPFAEALFERWPFDVIHAHTGLIDGVVGARLAERVGVPLLVTEHSSTAADDLADPEAADLYRPSVNGSGRRLVAVSRSLASAVGSRLRLGAELGLDEGAIAVLPNAVPIDGFPHGPAGSRTRGELLYVGSRKASKGIERLLRAFALAAASGTGAERPALRLRLLGSPGTAEEEAEWRRLIAELGLTEGESVTIEGPVGREAVSAAMRRAELFVHPSPRETFGVVVAEALASGLPVVTTPNGGGDEIVGSDGRFGVVARGMEPDDLAAAIREGLERADSGAFDHDGMRRHVEEAYAAPAVATRTVEHYLRLGARPGESPAAQVGGRPPSPTDRRPIAVVALARGQAVQRFNLLPAALRSRTTIVTMPPAPSGLNAAPLPPDGRWIELEIRPVDVGLAAVNAALRSLVDGNGWLVGLDADDILAIEPALGSGVDLGPGGMRWLADRDDEAAAEP